jgi:hypothetical protein
METRRTTFSCWATDYGELFGFIPIFPQPLYPCPNQTDNLFLCKTGAAFTIYVI